MKRISSLLLVAITIICFTACSPQKIITAGTRPKTSNVVNENIVFSTVPTVEEKGYSEIGEYVEDTLFGLVTGTYVSYKVTDIKTYASIEEAGLNIADMEPVIYGGFLDNGGNLDENYQFLLLSVDIYCSQKNADEDVKPDISRLSLVGTVEGRNIFDGLSTEPCYFFYETAEPRNIENQYSLFYIDVGEELSSVCGWIIPKDIKTDDLFLQIGGVSYVSDGSFSDDRAFISLSKGG